MHKCVRCGSIYEDNDSTILRGCAACGAIFFLYIKSREDMQQFDAVERELQKKDTSLEKELIKQIKKRKAKKKAKVAKKVKKVKKLRKKKVPKVPMKKVEIKEPKVRKEVIKIGEKKYALEDIFGVETVRIPKDGVYEINIDALMKKRPVVVLERGRVYLIHLPLLFEELAKGS